jgi:DNA polymerase III delta prime subunit
MKNISHASNPLYWRDYYGQEKSVNIAKQIILNGINDEKGIPRTIYISGHSGVGKTSFIRLLLRSLRCTGRRDDEYEPCGKCDNCTAGIDERLGGKAYGDTIWIQPGSRELGTLQAQVKSALIEASKGHTHTGRPDKDFLALVFDELQAFPQDIRTEILNKSEVEVPNNNVCFIFSTMREDKFNIQDRISLTRRSCPLKFLPFSEEEIVDYLSSKYPKAPSDTLNIVASSSERSLGLALAYLERIRQEDEEMHSDVAAHILELATPLQRKHLWECLENEIHFRDLKTICDNLLIYVSPLKLSNQLLLDIFNSIHSSPTNEQLFAIESLNQFQRNYAQLSLLSHLIPLYGLSIVDKSLFSKESKTLNYGI